MPGPRGRSLAGAGDPPCASHCPPEEDGFLSGNIYKSCINMGKNHAVVCTGRRTLPASSPKPLPPPLLPPGAEEHRSCNSLWVWAHVPASLPLPPSDSPRRGAALCCRAIPTPWKYAAVEPLNQLKGARSEVYLEKGFAVRQASTDSSFRNCRFWRRRAPLPPSIPPLSAGPAREAHADAPH